MNILDFIKDETTFSGVTKEQLALKRLSNEVHGACGAILGTAAKLANGGRGSMSNPIIQEVLDWYISGEKFAGDDSIESLKALFAETLNKATVILDSKNE